MNRPNTFSVRTKLCGVNANAWGDAAEYVRSKTNAPFHIFLSLDGHGPNGVERTAGGAWLLHGYCPPMAPGRQATSP